MTNSHALLIVLLSVGLILSVADLFVVTISVLLLIFAGLIFGVILNGLSNRLTKYIPLPYVVAYLIIVAILVLLSATGFSFLGSQIAARTNELWSQLQSVVSQLKNWLEQQPWADQYLPSSSELQSTLTKSSSMIAPGIVSWLSFLGWGLTGLLVILFVGLYSAYDPELYRSGLLKLFPKNKKSVANKVLIEVHSNLGRWIMGRVASMSIIGILTAIGLWSLGVPLPFTLGVVAAFLTFIPNIGPLLAAVPQLLLALNVGGSTALYVLLLNIILEGIESYLVTPIIQRQQVRMPPILLISAQVLMGVAFGIIGVMLAAPLVVVVLTLVQVLYIQETLGDTESIT